MRPEERIAVGLVVKLAVPLVLAGVAALGGSYYRYGPSPVFFVFVFGVLLVVLVLAWLIVPSQSAPAAGSLTVASDARRRINRRSEALIGSIRRARRRGRVRRVERAAAKASKHDELVEPSAVRTAAESVFRLVHIAWSARDRKRLAALLGPTLLCEAEHRLAVTGHAEYHERFEVVGDVHVDHVGFATAQAAGETRVVVLIEASLAPLRRTFKTELDQRRICQYWTLALATGSGRQSQSRNTARANITSPRRSPPKADAPAQQETPPRASRSNRVRGRAVATHRPRTIPSGAPCAASLRG